MTPAVLLYDNFGSLILDQSATFYSIIYIPKNSCVRFVIMMNLLLKALVCILPEPFPIKYETSIYFVVFYSRNCFPFLM